MTFSIKPRNCDDYKDIVHLDNKEQALEYFSTRIKLDKKNYWNYMKYALFIINKINLK